MTETRTIRDKKGRTIDCVVDVCFDSDGKPIAALTPVDLPPPPAAPWPDAPPASLETLNSIAHEFAHES